VRDLEDHPGSIPGLQIASDGDAMDEVFEDLDPVTDDLVGSGSVDRDDKADPACVVFLTGMIQTLCFHSLILYNKKHPDPYSK